MTGLPPLAVIVPVRNEARDLAAAVDAVLGQGYPGSLELGLAVGPSDDGTEAVAADLAARHPEVTVVDNPAGITPAGLNAAVAATTAAIVVRVDGHCRLSPGYLERAVATLERTGAVNVGGIQRAVGSTPFEVAVAAAMTSRFGVGDARFHYGGEEGPVDTVYLGVFRREALEAVGGYDESLIRNQDYELNWRLREAGGTVWFDPELWVEYRPRGSVRSLARQYSEYGWWKAEVVRRHPRSLRWRQAVPPLTVLGLVGGLLLAPFRRIGLVPAAVYGLGVLVAAGRTPVGRSGRGRLALVFPTMHLSWGVGFLAGAVRSWLRGR